MSKQDTVEEYLAKNEFDLDGLAKELNANLDLSLQDVCRKFGVTRHMSAIALMLRVDPGERNKRYRAWKAIRKPFDQFGEEYVRSLFEDLSLNTITICERLGISHTNYIKICLYLGFTADDRKQMRRIDQGLDPIVVVRNEFYKETLSGDGKSLEFLSRAWK